MSSAPEPKRPTEAPVKAAVKKILKAEGVYWTMPPANGYGTMGNFDITCCVNGMFLGIECKSTDKAKRTLLQDRNAELAMRQGGVALLIHKDNVHLVQHAINELRKRTIGVHVAMGLSYWPPAKESA